MTNFNVSLLPWIPKTNSQCTVYVCFVVLETVEDSLPAYGITVWGIDNIWSLFLLKPIINTSTIAHMTISYSYSVLGYHHITKKVIWLYLYLTTLTHNAYACIFQDAVQSQCKILNLNNSVKLLLPLLLLLLWRLSPPPSSLLAPCTTLF